ncbi:MAG: VacJ family lipoprotein [Gammaproteobacteria bacterium]|nr:MAG: VacJ family lipoprotein [Gammaproteobacteria bacterium]
MKTTIPNGIKALFILTAMTLSFGCTHVPVGEEAHDPYEETNRSIYGFNDSLDKNILKPVADGYAYITPDPVRRCVTNFFDNLGYLNTIANDLLQGKFEQCLADSGRFLINSTIGIVGIFDVATPMGLIKNEEDLGQTFAEWGSGEGAYLTLPFFGPNTTRDAPDLITSRMLKPTSYVKASIAWPLAVLDIINWRANMDTSIKMVDESPDPYLAMREFYRQNRIKLIYDGDPPVPDMMDDIDDFEDDEDLFEDEK